MKLDDYETLRIDQFKGMYKRGLADECPKDHAICAENVIFTKKGEVSTRPGSAVSYAMNHSVKRIFLASFDDNRLVLLTLDNNGNLYQDNNPTPLFSNAIMGDFAAYNLFNKCFILPICKSFPPINLKVWDGIHSVRDAAGLAPTSSFTAADGPADLTGGLDPGVHKFAVSFITNTGFTTQPGPKIAGVFTAVTYTAPGAKKVTLTGIPTGGSQVVGRQILVTRGNEDLFFYAPGGTINNNTTTTIDLDFFDSDLDISADELFDRLETIPGAVLAGALNSYHGRLVSTAQGDLVRVSLPGDPEAMDNVNGFIQVPDARDGNVTRAICEVSDVLYLLKFVGIFSTQDNGDVPSSWPLVLLDGGAGSYQFGISSITGSQPSLTANQIFTIADRDGLFLFNGVVIRPQLTWKIDDLWRTLTHGAEYNITTVIDPYNELIYCILPTNGFVSPNLLLVGDYSEGLNWKDIKWAVYFFPWHVNSIAMMNFQDQDGLSDYDYCLRMGTNDNNNLYKHHIGYTDDAGTAILSFYQTYLGTF